MMYFFLISKTMSLEIKPLKCTALPVKLGSDKGTEIFGVESCL